MFCLITHIQLPPSLVAICLLHFLLLLPLSPRKSHLYLLPRFVHLLPLTSTIAIHVHTVYTCSRSNLLFCYDIFLLLLFIRRTAHINVILTLKNRLSEQRNVKKWLKYLTFLLKRRKTLEVQNNQLFI